MIDIKTKDTKEYAVELVKKIKSLDEKNQLVIAGVATGLELADKVAG